MEDTEKVIRKIIKYKTFKSSAEFEKWQEESTEPRQINQIQPQLIEIGLGLEEYDIGNNTGAKGEGKTTFGIFVTYLEV